MPVGVELDDEMSADELLVHPQLLRQRHAGAGPVEGQHAGALDEDGRGNVRPHLEGPGFVHGGTQGLDGSGHYARQRLSTGRNESDIHKFRLKTGSLRSVPVALTDLHSPFGKLTTHFNQNGWF